MTREEAIKELCDWLEQMIQNGVPSHSAKRKALAYAISALSAEPYTDIKPITDDRPKGLYHGTLDVQSGVVTVTEPSDLISRAEAIEAIKAFIKDEVDLKDEDDEEYEHDIGYLCGLHRGKLIIKDIPSVSADRCGECRKELEDLLKQYAEVASKKKDIVAQHICDGISLSLGSIPAERVGKWVRRDNYKVMGEGYLWHCSLCDQSVYQDSSRDYPSETYCPNCGARMENKK